MNQELDNNDVFNDYYGDSEQKEVGETAGECFMLTGLFVTIIGGTLYVVHIMADAEHFSIVTFISAQFIFFVIGLILLCCAPCAGVIEVFLTGNGTYKEGARNGYKSAYKCICSIC